MRSAPFEEYLRPTIESLSHGIRARQISPTELTHECLAHIEKLNPKLNAFITVLAESALEEARRAEQEIFRGNYRGPLHGIPIGLKDIIDTAGTRTTAASALFKDRIPTEDAEVVRRLRADGAIILGKQNLHEFAYGASCLISSMAKSTIHGTRRVWLGGRRVDRPPRSRARWALLPSARILRGRFACPPLIAAWWDLSLLTDA